MANPTPRADALRQMREAKFEAEQRRRKQEAAGQPATPAAAEPFALDAPVADGPAAKAAKPAKATADKPAKAKAARPAKAKAEKPPTAKAADAEAVAEPAKTPGKKAARSAAG